MNDDPTLLVFLEAATEMCEAWDDLRAVLDGTDGSGWTVEEGRAIVKQRTQRMIDARANIASIARGIEAQMPV